LGVWKSFKRYLPAFVDFRMNYPAAPDHIRWNQKDGSARVFVPQAENHATSPAVRLPGLRIPNRLD
jgi:hypothetical protein